MTTRVLFGEKVRAETGAVGRGLMRIDTYHSTVTEVPTYLRT